MVNSKRKNLERIVKKVVISDDNSEDCSYSDKTEDTTISNIAETRDEIKQILEVKEIYDYNIAKKFFKKHPDYAEKIVLIKNQKYVLSLRILDWFVTNYTKKNNVTYKVMIDGKEKKFDVYISYDSQLKHYKKTRFDPFARKNKEKKGYFVFRFPKTDKKIKTNIKQLNFLVWAFKYKIIDYVEANLDELSKAMIQDNKSNKEKRAIKKQEKTDKKKMLTVIKNKKESIIDKMKPEKKSFDISFE